MNNVISARAIVVISMFFLAVACKKEYSFESMPLTTIPHPPIARAGMDTTIFYPFIFYTLNGSFSSDPDSNIVSFSWRTLSGPSTISLTNPDNAISPVDGLNDLGNYVFELTVTDTDNLSGKDTVMVTLAAPVCNGADNEVILKDMEWDYSWIMEIDLWNFFTILPPNSHLKNIYIKRDGSSDWEKVIPYNNIISNTQFYTWSYGNNDYGNNLVVILPVYTNMTNDTPDIKIEYCM
jgi:hypothetical protein